MFPFIELQQSSGMSQKRFCREHLIPQHVFSYWLKKYRDQQAPSGGFVSLGMARPQGEAEIRLVLPGGQKLEFAGLVPATYLAELMRELS